MRYADDGFGNMVNVANPFGHFTRVYMRLDGKLAVFDVGTQDRATAALEVHRTVGDVRLSGTRWKLGPALSVVGAGA